MQSTAYRGGTGLPERITTACGDRSRTVEVAYPEASRGGVEAAMVSAGAVGVALRGVTTRGSAVTTTEAEYEHLSGRLFRTARTRRWHSGMADTLVSPRYSYNGLGQLAGITDGDGVYPRQPTEYQTAFVFLHKNNHMDHVPSWAVTLALEGPAGCTNDSGQVRGQTI